MSECEMYDAQAGALPCPTWTLPPAEVTEAPLPAQAETAAPLPVSLAYTGDHTAAQAGAGTALLLCGLLLTAARRRTAR